MVSMISNSQDNTLLTRIHWLGHSSFRVGGEEGNSGPVIYFDPWRLPENQPPADVILISSADYDHCSPEDIAAIRQPDTILVSNKAATGIVGPDVTVLRAWQSITLKHGLTLRGVPAYNLNSTSHGKEDGGLGFVLTLPDHTAIYFAGHTGYIPEMKNIFCDVALLPVDGRQTMTAEEAARVVQELRPEFAIPMHYGTAAAGTRYDGNRFCDLVKPPVKAVQLPNQGKSVPHTGPLLMA